MVDVNRIRERAAEWLGQVGDAAIGLTSRAFQWSYFRSTGDVWSACHRAIGLAPSLRWVLTGRDERRVGPDMGDAFAQGVRQAEIGRDGDSDDALRARIKAQPQGRATPLVASAVAKVPESPTDGAGVSPEVLAHALAAELFSTVLDHVDVPDARQDGLRDEMQAAAKSLLSSFTTAPPCSPVLLVGQDRAADNGPWCDRHGGRFADAAPSSGAQGVPLVDGVDAWIGQPARDLAAKWNAHAGLSGMPEPSPTGPTGTPGQVAQDGAAGDHDEPPDDLAPDDEVAKAKAASLAAKAWSHAFVDPGAPTDDMAPVNPTHNAPVVALGGPVETPDPRWEPGAAWECKSVSGNMTRFELVRRDVDGRVWLRTGSEVNGLPVSPCDMTEANGWRFVPAKPLRVEPGQVWRCVGIDGELVVRDRVELASGGATLGLAPVDSPKTTTVRATEDGMLGLKEWTFVRGPR